MDLPQTVRPSPLSPHFFVAHVASVVLAVIVAGIVSVIVPYLDFLPFNPVWLYLLAVLPLLIVVRTEFRRRRYTYEFHDDRVLIRHGFETVQQDDVPYQKITDISSVTPPFEGIADVGDLELHIAGTDTDVTIIGVKHPDRYEDLMLGRTGGGSAADMDDAIATTRQELQQLEQRYNNGEIGRAEYEQDYYYLQGKLDAYREVQGDD